VKVLTSNVKNGNGGSRRSLLLRSIYAICLAAGTPAHVLFDLRYGLLLTGLEPLGYPLVVRLYWASLTFLDPIGVLLLIVWPRAGLILCVGIIVTDVANNSWVCYLRSGIDMNYILEVAFLLFVMTTVRYAWEGLPRKAAA
jgi:hypothetical protein